MSRSLKNDDPRDASLEEKIVRPNSWDQSQVDGTSSSSMLLSGLTMVTRRPAIAWMTIGLSLWGYLNSHPLRTKDGGTAGQGMIFALGAIITAYVPRFIIGTSPLTPLTS